MEAKIVFITGASSGIGEGCARKFAREGWNLILNARTVSKLEELKANMEKSKKELEHAIHNKNILEQRKRIVERKERSHRLIVKGAEFEKAFPLSRDLEQEEVQDVMEQLQNSSYNKSIVRQVYIAALHKEQQQIAEAVERAEKGDDS